MENLCHLILTDDFETATISIPDPYEADSIINLFIHEKKDPKISVQLINGTPFISCSITLSADILSLDANSNYSNKEALDLISTYANSYLEKALSSYLYKMSKEYHSDIDDYGKYVIKNYKTWNDWIESDWLANFENAFFTIHVDTNVQNGQLYTKI
ncbi:MAG: Ger(x)C family spore germination C-terminal domain-containing protein [Clostridia bacterium]|nr:Ger(x)C family spore germination C-terminal domain-containing protein [Clostridia bacterium]